MLDEGVYDPSIFKAVFLAGAGGSGKSYVANHALRGLGLKTINTDIAFENFLKKANLSLKMPDSEKEERDAIRFSAKKLTSKLKNTYQQGRLGLLIDGTGRNFKKIKAQADKLKEIGYDVKMVFVNTSLETALKRNSKRERSVPESIVKNHWYSVQSNIGKFQRYFGNENFTIIDNNNATKEDLNSVFKEVKNFVESKPKNQIAQNWINTQLKQKRNAN